MIFIEAPTTELFLTKVIERTRCTVHNKDATQPCWWVPMSTYDGVLPAVCNARALNAGFVGRIDPRSLQSTRKPR